MKRIHFLSAVLGSALCAHAQVGPGTWTEYVPRKAIQMEAGEAYNAYRDSGGVETFSMSPNPGGLRQRCEMRVYDDYTGGIRQFEGYAKVDAGADGACIHQVWLFLMIVAWKDHGGELRQHSTGTLNLFNAYGKWIRINTIHNADTHSAEIWINGEKRYTMVSKNGPSYYHKYGLYNGSSTYPRVQWRGVRFFSSAATALLPAGDDQVYFRQTGNLMRINLGASGPAALKLTALTGQTAAASEFEASRELSFTPPRALTGTYLLQVQVRGAEKLRRVVRVGGE